MINTIYLRRASKVIVNRRQNPEPVSKTHLATALKNIAQLGFAFSPPLMHAVRTMSQEEFASFYDGLVADLKVMVGAHVPYTPMYPDFPVQVMEETDAELYLNAVYHYLTLNLPEGEPADRPPLPDEAALKVIDLGSKAEFHAMIRRVIQAKGSISETDQKDIDAAIEHAEPHELDDLLPDEIPFKENAGFVAAFLMKHDKANLHLIGKYFKTATDVLRLAAAWSDGDVSLAQATRFRKFKRRERRLLLGLLEQCGGQIAEDMLRYKERWVRLGEILHPSEYGARFKRCGEAFDILRNDKTLTTWGGKRRACLSISQRLDVDRSVDAASGRIGQKIGSFAAVDRIHRLCCAGVRRGCGSGIDARAAAGEKTFCLPP